MVAKIRAWLGIVWTLGPIIQRDVFGKQKMIMFISTRMQKVQVFQAQQRGQFARREVNKLDNYKPEQKKTCVLGLDFFHEEFQ